jgi:copper chaperone CopZ
MSRLLYLGLVVLSSFALGACSDRSANSSGATAANAQLTTLRFKVTGMHCGGCASSIQDSLVKLPGVASCEASYENQSVTLKTTDPSIASKAIEEIVALGYAAEAAEG